MHFTSEQRLDDGSLQREFTLGDIPGILWTPTSSPAPLILLGHPGGPGGLRNMYPRLASRARHSSATGFAAATIELPGSGDRPRSADAEQARTDLHRALEAGEPVDEIVDRLVIPLVEKAVPEWQSTLDALLSLPEVSGPVHTSLARSQHCAAEKRGTSRTYDVQPWSGDNCQGLSQHLNWYHTLLSDER
jgi:hypothetical protein